MIRTAGGLGFSISLLVHGGLAGAIWWGLQQPQMSSPQPVRLAIDLSSVQTMPPTVADAFANQDTLDLELVLTGYITTIRKLG